MRGLERRSLAAFLAQVRGRVGSDELAISMPCMALRAVFLEPRRACFASVFTSTLARDGRTDETVSSGSFSNPPRDVKYIMVSDHIMLWCHFC